MASIGKLMKQAAKMQRQMQEAQAQLADQIVEASSGGGAVKVTASCDGAVKSISIDPDAVDAIRAVMGWNTMFDHRATVITPVSRSFGQMPFEMW